MSLRIAWACYQRDIRLGIAAQIFVYVGTIILFIVNWFFTQRIVRAQHPQFGWSRPYRVLHRLAIACLILCLIMLIIAAIQQFYTLNTTTLRIDRDLQLAGQTYFAVFCSAPIVGIIASLVFPRHGTEKFGAGRLRNCIAILLISATVLSVGQIFRCATAWLPPKPLRNAQGRPISSPWYYSKACFYTFNFTTEILVVIFYAIIRVDLRFHVPNGSKKAGDYSGKHASQYHVNLIGNENNLKRSSTNASVKSNETLYEYEVSLFDDTRTLADSLRYPSTVLEIDPKSGHWKIKRASHMNSVTSFHHSNRSQSSLLWDSKRGTAINDTAPPVPDMPTDWPLRESQMPLGQIPVLEHRNRSSRSPVEPSSNDAMNTPDMEKGNAIEEAIKKLEANSEVNKPPPGYDADEPFSKKSRDSLSPTDDHQAGNIPRKYTYTPDVRPSSDLPKKHDYSASSNRYYSPPSSATVRPPVPQETQTHSSIDTESAEAEREFARFSFETSPRDALMSGSEKDYERRYRR